MSKFAIYSLLFHLLLFFIVLVFSFFTPKPKSIQIKLATLQSINNTKKTVSSAKIEQEKQQEQEQKKQAEAQTLLNNVLKSDIKEKIIEKQVTEEPKKIEKEEATDNNSKVITKKTAEAPKNNVSNKPSNTNKDINSSVLIPSKLIENQILKSKPETTKAIAPKINNSANALKSDPYLNPIMPTQNNKEEKKENYNNPYNNAVMPQQSAPVNIPAKKEIDVSSVKEDDMSSVVQKIKETPVDIMSSNTYGLSNSEKEALNNQISKCLASVGVVRENTETITLIIEMQPNAKIKDIHVIRDNRIIPNTELTNLESRVIYLFNNPKCSTLILPDGKFNYWKKFTIKINLKGLFE